jgi:DNA polymerase
MELRVLNPSLVFLLGKQVASFVFKRYLNKEAKLDKAFNYQPHLYNGMYFVPVHHPSYMLIYKRKYIQDYKRSIRRLLAFSANSEVAAHPTSK